MAQVLVVCSLGFLATYLSIALVGHIMSVMIEYNEIWFSVDAVFIYICWRINLEYVYYLIYQPFGKLN